MTAFLDVREEIHEANMNKFPVINKSWDARITDNIVYNTARTESCISTQSAHYTGLL